MNVQQTDTATMTAKFLQQRGQDLRREIDAHYEKLLDSKTLKIQGQGVNVITDLVAKYLSIGMPMEDAFAILRAAGFKIESNSKNPRFPADPEEFVTIASIFGYRTQFFFSETSVDIYLLCSEEIRPQTFTRMKAHISKSTL